jgi:hypothetical protein
MLGDKACCKYPSLFAYRTSELAANSQIRGRQVHKVISVCHDAHTAFMLAIHPWTQEAKGGVLALGMNELAAV